MPIGLIEIPRKEVHGMDTNMIYLGTAHYTKPAFSDEAVRLPAASVENHSAHERQKFDYDTVMMDLEDVKNFLYMLIGGSLLRVKDSENLGVNVNKTA